IGNAPNLARFEDVDDVLKLPVLAPDPKAFRRPKDAQVPRGAAESQLPVGQTPVDAVPRMLRRLHPPLGTQCGVLALQVLDELDHVSASVLPMAVESRRALCGNSEVGTETRHSLPSEAERPGSPAGGTGEPSRL